MKRLIVYLCILTFACTEHDFKESSFDLGIRNDYETAFPFEVGTPISLGGSGAHEVVIIKKGGVYVWMGDIILTERQVQMLSERMKKESSRTALQSISTLWPSATVYYTIDPNLPDQDRVTDAITHWEDQAPYLRFIERTNQQNYIEFVPGAGCSSYLGMIGGRQVVTLQNECTTGNTIHEIGHALGLLHEHTRVDRNNSIIVNNNNILQGFQSQFNIYTDENIDGFEIGALDFGSIMLYGSFAFSANGQPTITRLDGSVFEGQRIALSAGDLEITEILHGPPFARIENQIIEDYNAGGTEYRDEEFFVSFFQDRNLTIPLSIQNVTTFNYSVQETHYGQNPNYTYWTTTNISQALQPGNNRYSLGVYRTHSCEYDYNGNQVGDCFSTSLYSREGLRYNITLPM